MKLNLKLFIIILEISIIPLLIVGYIAYFNINQQITSNILSKIDIIAQIQKNRLQSNIDDSIELIRLFTAKSQLRLLLSNFNDNPTKQLQESMNNNILDSKDNSVAIKKILIANPSGIIVASTDVSLIGNDISDKDFFKQGIKQNDVSSIIKDSVTGEIEQYFVGPMTLNNKIIGMGIIIVNADDIISLVADYTGLGDTGEVLLVKNDGNGNALFLSPTRFDENATFRNIISKEKNNSAAIFAINGEEKAFTDAINFYNKPVFAATRYIKSTGWGIVVEIDQSEALVPLEKLQRLFLFILFTVTFLIIVIVIPASLSITKPIKELILISKKITEGDLTQNLQIKSKDEIGELSYFLNKMLDSLKKISENFKNLNLTLEEKVRLKTVELKDKNIFLSEANSAMVNLSEDLEAEKNKLQISKTNMEAIITGIGDALIATDSNGIITIVNPAAEKLFSHKSSEFVGKSIFESILLEDENGKIVSKEKRPVFITFSTKTYYYVGKNKNRITVAVTSGPIILENNTIGVVDIFRDITKEKEIDRAKTEFVSLASHQLRTPATAVKWYSEMLFNKKTGKLNAKQTRYLSAVYHGNERMVKLIDNLLKVSRIELGKMLIQKEAVNIKKVVEDIVKEQTSEIEKKGHKLIIKNLQKVKEITTDSTLLRAILQNFVSNAIKYTPNKGEIIFTVEKEDSKVIFSVKDNGIGIPKEEQKRIFDKLFRASNSLEVDKEGNGLGLYIAKQMAINLGGKVWFESAEGKGSTFYLELPEK